MTIPDYEIALMTMATQAMDWIIEQDKAHDHKHQGWGILADALDYDTVAIHIQRIGFKDLDAAKRFYTADAEKKRF